MPGERFTLLQAGLLTQTFLIGNDRTVHDGGIAVPLT